jgi:hypothetical protein
MDRPQHVAVPHKERLMERPVDMEHGAGRKPAIQLLAVETPLVSRGQALSFTRPSDEIRCTGTMLSYRS